MRKIISDPEISAALEKTLAATGVEDDYVVVDLGQPDRGGLRQTAANLTEVPIIAATYPDTPIIAVGFENRERYVSDPRWRKIEGLPNVVFRNLPLGKDDLISAIAEARNRLRAE